MKRLIPILSVALAVASFCAHAEGNKYNGENRGKPVMPAQVNTKFQQECASCHMAYSPGLLPAASWAKIMAGLDRHFGADASVTPSETTEIANWLAKNASNRWTASTAPLRISESAWFKAKHNSREIAPDVWKRASIKSPANCTACHSAADKGDFNENTIKIPK